MEYLKLGTVIFTLCLLSCNNKQKESADKVDTSKTFSVKIDTSKTSKSSENSNDKLEIQDLIRKVLKWNDTKGSFDLLPLLTDRKDSVYVGFDLGKHMVNLEKLKATNFFTSGFIENYNQIILTLDKGLRNNKYDKWSTGELPTFSFANDIDPWCDCQDNLSWDLVETQIISLNSEKGELYWKWGKTELEKSSPDWKEFRYKFEVEKEKGKWKISYLQGFDFKESTKKVGF